MPAPDLPFLPLTELSRQLAAGTTTSRGLVEACLARIDALDGRLHAFVDVYREGARRLADAADLERAAGFVRGPLHGLPIAIKDLFDIAGRPTTAGSRSWRNAAPQRTAHCVRRLLDAGMIPLGKTHMVEFAFGTWGTNRPLGAPWNPWDPHVHRVAGGSSSGSAVAVAAGMAPAALGSDTGGSVRIPAALCGLTGFKPTYGAISLDGVVPLSPTLDSIGPLTRTIEDAMLLTAAMAGGGQALFGADPLLATGASPARGDFAGLRGLRITALSAADLPAFTEPDVRAALEATKALLGELGATIEEQRPPFDFAGLGAKNGRLISIEAYARHRAVIDDDALDVDPGVRARMRTGRGVSAADYLEALAERHAAMAAFADWMHGRDALLTPMLPITAQPVAAVDETTYPLATWSRAVNYLGACAVSLPAGLSAGGLPIGMQVVAAAGHERMLVRIGRAFQRATDWHRRHPSDPRGTLTGGPADRNQESP